MGGQAGEEEREREGNERRKAKAGGEQDQAWEVRLPALPVREQQRWWRGLRAALCRSTGRPNGGGLEGRRWEGGDTGLEGRPGEEVGERQCCWVCTYHQLGFPGT